ncbi:MAG: hypothetical protein RBS57_05190 [Desulforhabdus sp.]|jgi:hypothetical protein|nr:hypothetical protein [Desulforhabdus sp.]
MSTKTPEVMDLTKVASTFPQLKMPNIQRENMITTITEMLGGETEVVVVDGPCGIGKTTLLAQFSTAFPNHAFGLFVRSSSRWAYDSGMLTRDLCDQICWALKKEAYREEKDTDVDPVQLLRTRIFELQRQANFERSTYYFVVDGLNEIPEEECHELEMILKLLPFGIPRFRFVLSGPLERLKSRPHKLGEMNSFRMIGFTLEETREFFNGLIEDSIAIETIHKVCGFVPGKLASVRRLLQAGHKVERLLEELPERAPDLFELEWRVVENEDALLRQALAILAFDQRRHTLASLSLLCKTEPTMLDEKLSRCTFVERRNDGQEIDFVCEGFKRLAAQRLSTLKRSVLDAAILDLMASSESPDALTHLPSFFHQAGRYEDLLTYLSPQHIGSLIDCGESWIPLHQKADLGVETALRLERDGDLLRFGLQRATITSMESSEPWRSEIDAYVSLDDFSAAYALVQRMVTREDRLHLLSVIARAKKTKSLPIEQELSDQIKQHYGLLDRSSLGERGVEIASDLLYTHPELAVDLVQECMGKDGAGDKLNLALAKLSFKALTEKEEGTAGMDSTQQVLRAKVKDPKVQKFMDTISLFFGGYTAEGVIAEVDKWEKASDRIFALRSWAVTNAKKKDAATVIEYALSTILKTTTYTANAKVYKDLASPLGYIPDLDLVKTIIGKLDGLKGVIQSAGPTVEYVKLQAMLAEAEVRYDKQATSDRLENLYFDIDAITEPGTKLAALAVLARVLKKVAPDKQFEARSGIHSAVVEGLQVTVDEILTKTADHYTAVRPAIKALAQSDTKIALEVLAKLNTAPSREAALVKFMQAIAGEHPSDVTFAVINDAYNTIKSIPKRAEATRVVLRALLTPPKDMAAFLEKIIAIKKWVVDIPDAEEKCQALCMFMELLMEHKKDCSSSLLDSLSKELEMTWEIIDAGWSKVDAGFRIVALMAKSSPEVSQSFLGKTEKARRDIVLDCRDTAMTYIGCVRLAIRCFGGLLKRKRYDEIDLEALKELIDKIPSIGTRVAAWSELSLKFFMAHDLKRCQQIVSELVLPILESDSISDSETRWQVIVSVSPALYCAHNTSAMQLIAKLPQPYRDGAYCEICSFLVTKQLPTENYDSASEPKGKASYEDFLDVCGVLQCIETDHAAYEQIESLADNLHKRFKKEFNKQQIADMLRQLRSLVETKFPNPEYIKHEGYKILGEAQIARLEREKYVWDDLAKRARNIPNVADSAFVLMKLGAAMPTKARLKAIELLQEAKALIPKIATIEDRCSRYEELAKTCTDLDRTLSKECLRKAWSEIVPLDPNEFPRARQRIIDFAHRLDPEFAASLASESDNDPGREFARAQTKQRLELLKLQKRVASGERDAIKPTHGIEQQVAIARMMLASLNSGRVEAVRTELTRQFIKQASQMNVQDAYVVLSWVIENAVRRHSDTDQANTYLRPLFEAARLSAELAFRIAARIRSVTDSGISAARRSDSSSSALIRPGEREKALSILKDWASQATQFIKITDPYFGLDELEFVKLIRSVNASIPVFILTSQQRQQDLSVPLKDCYQSHWRINLSDSDAGEVKIIVVGKGATGGHPIHDRWWLTEGGGLRVGTSANSLGVGKLSEVSAILADDATTKLHEVDRYLNASVRGEGTERLSYLQFWL